MAQMSVEQFANELGLLPTVLLEQLKAAGVKKTLAEDSLTEQDKAQLLDYLRRTHGATETKSKVTLTRRQTSEIRKSDSTGRPRTIQVEVRKRRVLTKLTAGDSESESTAVTSPDVVIPPVRQSVINAEQLALRNEEARKQAELIARQAEEVQQKRARKKTELIEDIQKKEETITTADATSRSTKQTSPTSAEPEIGIQPESAKKIEPEQQSKGQLHANSTEGTLHKP
ncbi:MAG: translation initiation factor IF-2 associated domain-containing protein, partial [Nitrosomonas sp.]|nr:translation initiation factor IF-2 associated domain-containing protein [Nitrosomonas sp.]